MKRLIAAAALLAALAPAAALAGFPTIEGRAAECPDQAGMSYCVTDEDGVQLPVAYAWDLDARDPAALRAAEVLKAAIRSGARVRATDVGGPDVKVEVVGAAVPAAPAGVMPPHPFEDLLYDDPAGAVQRFGRGKGTFAVAAGIGRPVPADDGGTPALAVPVYPTLPKNEAFYRPLSVFCVFRADDPAAAGLNPGKEYVVTGHVFRIAQDPNSQPRRIATAVDCQFR